MNKILFFAHLRDVVGQDHVQLDANGLTVTELKQRVAEKYDVKVDNVMVSINEEFATESDIIQSDDVIAFIPPVSGG